MYIPKNDKKIIEPADNVEIDEESEKLEAPQSSWDETLAAHPEDVLMRWGAPEFEIIERDHKWYLYISLILIGLISYAVFTNSPVMAITFILIGVVGYIHINKDPRYMTFAITKNGIVAGKELYPYKNLKSFWIFYEPHDIHVISLKTNSYLAPYLHIPIEEEEPVKMREILLKYIPEEKHEPGILETLNRLLRL